MKRNSLKMVVVFRGNFLEIRDVNSIYMHYINFENWLKK